MEIYGVVQEMTLKLELKLLPFKQQNIDFLGFRELTTTSSCLLIGIDKLAKSGRLHTTSDVSNIEKNHE